MKQSPSQNSYPERLAEKLKRQADKCGAKSFAAEELKNLAPQPVEGVTPQRRVTRAVEGVTKET